MSWWDPISWVKATVHAGVDIEKDIRKWVVPAIRDAVNAVHRDLDDFAGDVGRAFDDVRNVASDIRNDVDAAWNWIRDTGEDILGDAERYVDIGITDAVHAIEDAGGFVDRFVSGALGAFERDVVDPIDDALTAAWHYVESEAIRLYDDVKSDLVAFETTAREWVDDAIHLVEHYADDAISVFERDIVDPIGRSLVDLWGEAVKLTDDVWHEAMAAVHLVEEAADWLELLAVHTVEDIESLPSDILAHIARDAVEQYVSGQLHSDLDTIRGYLEQWG